MPNKFTASIDLAHTLSEDDISFCSAFDAVFGKWRATEKQSQKWQDIRPAQETPEAETLFWCFIAELSDQDLQECFPELFSDMYPEQQKD